MRTIVVALLAMTAFVWPATADVAFDPATGTGSVGRGDILSTLGADAVTPEGAEQVVFHTRLRSTWRTLCKERRKPNQQEFDRHRTVHTIIESEVDLNPQDAVVGFDLTGNSTSVTKGRFCPRHWLPVGEPQLVSTGRVRLFAAFGDKTARIWVEE